MVITIETVKLIVERKCGLKDISIKTRRRPYPEIRSVAYKLCKDFIPKVSLSAIGNGFNKRDHATILHGLKLFENLKNQKDFKDKLDIYIDCFKELMLFSKDVNFDDFSDSLKLKTLKDYYRVKFIQLIDKQHRVINNQQKQIFKLSKRSVFNEMSELNDSDFKELEVRINAFLNMNKSKKCSE